MKGVRHYPGFLPVTLICLLIALMLFSRQRVNRTLAKTAVISHSAHLTKH